MLSLTYSYWDKRWKSSFMFYSGFSSASPDFLAWMKEQVSRLFGIVGNINSCGKSAYQLVFSKQNSITLMQNIYYCDTISYLTRKKLKIDAALSTINKQAGMAKW